MSESQIWYGNFYEDWNQYQADGGAGNSNYNRMNNNNILIPYWHNPNLNLSTWIDPMFILSVLKTNHVENSIDMIPLSWHEIEDTPFIQVSLIDLI
jgi:hypothetical protein